MGERECPYLTIGKFLPLPFNLLNHFWILYTNILLPLMFYTPGPKITDLHIPCTGKISEWRDGIQVKWYRQDHLPNGGLHPSGKTMLFIDFFKNEKRAKCKEVETLPLLDISMCSHVLVRQKSITFNKNTNHRVKLTKFDFLLLHKALTT